MSVKELFPGLAIEARAVEVAEAAALEFVASVLADAHQMSSGWRHPHAWFVCARLGARMRTVQPATARTHDHTHVVSPIEGHNVSKPKPSRRLQPVHVDEATHHSGHV